MTVRAPAPLLLGDLGRHADEVLKALAADLVLASQRSEDGSGAHFPGPGLGGGCAGVALFLGHYTAAGAGTGVEIVAARRLLRVAIVSAMRAPPGLSLCDGIGGIAWAVGNLGGAAVPVGHADPVADVDEALSFALDSPDIVIGAELLYGLAGYAVCCLDRPASATVERTLARICDALAATAVPVRGGLVWGTPRDGLKADLRLQFPSGRVDLGIAHGTAGIASVLARMAARGVAGAADLADQAIGAVLAEATGAAEGTRIPPFIGYDLTAGQARTAWCYGDLGVAAAMLSAARYLDRADWEHEAVALARSVAARPADRMNTLGTGLCHGTAGIAYLFNRFFRATGEETLGAAAAAWYQRLLAQRRGGQGIGGYGSVRAGPGGDLEWWADPGLLDGATGVGLALLAATVPDEPGWDNALAISIPPAGMRS